MALQQHLQLLNQGVPTWNRWRDENPTVRPDLSGSDLRKRMLRNANLSASNLAGADLRDVNFRRADLSGANLDRAKLYRAFISGANLNQTTFRATVLYETVFANVALSAALHLDQCVHKGPSVIDHRTLARSKGLSREFLRGCGLPDYVIEDALEPERRIDRYWSCFISYSSQDQEFVDRLHSELQAKGVRCWFAPKDMPIGAKIRDTIDEAIRGNEKVLLVLSEHSISSNWVEKETETAFEEESRRNGIVLFPIRLDNSAMTHGRSWIADIRRTRNIGDFSKWKEAERYNAAFARLLRDLQREDHESSD
jgi:hypothetical protein